MSDDTSKKEDREFQPIRDRFITKKEKAENNMNSESSSRKWGKGLIVSVLSLIVALAALSFGYMQTQQALDVAGKNLELQNMLSNFTSVITAKPQVGFLYSNSFENASNQITVSSYGHLNISLEVITPHYGRISIEVKNLTDIDPQGMMNPNKKNQTTVSYVWEDEKYEKTVVMGLNSFVADLELKATTYPDPQQLPAKGQITRFSMGRLLLEAILFDLYSNKTTTIKEFNATIAVEIFVPWS